MKPKYIGNCCEPDCPYIKIYNTNNLPNGAVCTKYFDIDAELIYCHDRAKYQRCPACSVKSYPKRCLWCKKINTCKEWNEVFCLQSVVFHL